MTDHTVGHRNTEFNQRRIIGKSQRLQRRVGTTASCARVVSIGAVKSGQHGIDVCTINCCVHSSAKSVFALALGPAMFCTAGSDNVGWDGRKNTWSADLAAQFIAAAQRKIANDLGLHTKPILV